MTRARGVPMSRGLPHSQVASALPALRRPLRPRSCPPRHAGRLSLTSARYFGACRCCAPALAAAPPAQSCARARLSCQPRVRRLASLQLPCYLCVATVSSSTMAEARGGPWPTPRRSPAPTPGRAARLFFAVASLLLARCATHAPTSWLCVVLAAALALTCFHPFYSHCCTDSSLAEAALPALVRQMRHSVPSGRPAGCTHAGPL